jgi:hypothetical protein
MFRAKPTLSRMSRQLWGILTKKSSRPPEVLLGDPAASRPQDLDDPFVDATAQRRVADVIARAAEQKSKGGS